MGRRADQIDDEMSTFLAGIDDMEDPRKAWAVVRQRIEALQQGGQPVPDVLLKVERQLTADCMAQSQGR